ncbi:AbgT family transporter [Pseudoalteromonas flavipulchra]|uniref:AbgT family transporter n=2 Tax=Pseudoalteromonas maricaloris TaxID=184924 RepID=A0A8I2KNR6_9GAMM|nr:aminobenzoyl-glutamate transporter [Pseudoalteromonas flavipulchra NCIMB 2033 = ATCC BAA-314]MBD0780609.1 AbgT family transporter [Pseudoalteromonas flavipulchra]NLR23091.1 AbgT family transporter [Pseudoalteromonas maricaloris]ODB41914.1 aminobenzoyl-glutamate transporter [Pseudoalteromonas sp. BMB]RZF99752.1 AbgT family transporter [Pseudoalteromonas sp. CO348]RZG12572.1 AbgT family transporter [Pseudoalteromonas sp. CO342X]
MTSCKKNAKVAPFFGTENLAMSNAVETQADSQDQQGQKGGLFNRFLATVEFLGNMLPHPITLFAMFCIAIVLFSGIADWMGLSAIDPRPEGSAGRDPDGVIEVVSLMSAEGLQRIVTGLVTNFTGFAPLGTVLVALLGVSVAEHSGMLSAAMRGMVMGASKRLVTFMIVFAAILSNTASELGYVVLIPLAAMIFHSLGRHPLAGLAAAFAGVSGGYSANLLLGTIDPLLAGITTPAAQMIDPTYQVGPEANWYFMMISVFLIAIVGTLVTEKIVEPRLGKYDPKEASVDLSENNIEKLSAKEKSGLKWAGVSLLVVSILLALTIVPEDGILRHPVTGEVAGSPFLKGIVVFIFVTFAIPGFVYGRVVGTMKNDRDIIDAMSKSMSSMGMYIVLVFFAAQFVAFFKWTNLGTILAINGAALLQALNLTGPEVFVLFIFMCALVNLSLGSSSAQWAVTAPIFVPMLMLIGYAPETIQAAYRIGDSVTNLITPMMSYFGLILAVATKYKKDMGIGTLVATMLPYSMFFFIGWVALFYVWVFGFGLPVGPNSPIYYNP